MRSRVDWWPCSIRSRPAQAWSQRLPVPDISAGALMFEALDSASSESWCILGAGLICVPRDIAELGSNLTEVLRTCHSQSDHITPCRVHPSLHRGRNACRKGLHSAPSAGAPSATWPQELLARKVNRILLMAGYIIMLCPLPCADPTPSWPDALRPFNRP